MTDKVILSNGAALAAKYQPSGVKAISGAVRKLIAADKTRKLTTVYIELDDAESMKAYGAPPVSDPANAQQVKKAIDSIYKSLAPDYILLLGAVDVIPHAPLTNPVYSAAAGDADQLVPSDLPYACEAPYSNAIEKFIAPTRVIGRLPDVTGASDPDYLVSLLNTACAAQSRPQAGYEDYLALSASVWRPFTDWSDRALGI